MVLNLIAVLNKIKSELMLAHIHVFFFFIIVLLLILLSSALSQGENDTSQNEQMLGKSGGKRQYTLFQGHSGPVYAASFCPVGDFILSSSADSTSMVTYLILIFSALCFFAFGCIFFVYFIL
jgi:WD40 repeat protein